MERFATESGFEQERPWPNPLLATIGNTWQLPLNRPGRTNSKLALPNDLQGQKQSSPTVGQMVGQILELFACLPDQQRRQLLIRLESLEFEQEMDCDE